MKKNVHQDVTSGQWDWTMGNFLLSINLKLP